MFAFTARFGLRVLEAGIADGFERHVEDRFVIAAVVRERREVLIDDLVVVRECVWRNEIAPADFGGIDANLMRRDIEQSFNDKDAVLAAGAAIGRYDR